MLLYTLLVVKSVDGKRGSQLYVVVKLKYTKINFSKRYVSIIYSENSNLRWIEQIII